MGVENGRAQLADKTLQATQIFLRGQKVELLLQLVDLPLQVRNLQMISARLAEIKLRPPHLEVEVALGACPLTVDVQRVPGQEVSLLTGLAEDAGDVGAELRGVPTPLTGAVKIPLRLQSPPALVSAQVGAVVLDRQLLPLRDTPPRLHPDLVGGAVQAELGVADTAVVQEGEGWEYRPATDACQKVEITFETKIN